MPQSCLLTIVILSTASAAVFATDASRPPNVVFLFADDLGFSDPHCYGHPYARTPNIDRLAREGTRFTQFYVTGVTCCPSRTGFMTSRFPARFATYPANGGFGDRVTITELLHRTGYATGHFGKWHIGPEMKPGTYGIDVTPITEERPRKRHNTRGRDAPIYDEAIRFIEQHADRPFYVNVWGHSTHHPVNPPQSCVDRFQDLVVREADFPEPMREKFALAKSLGGDVNVAMRNYLGELSALDDDIGRLLTRLDELGLAQQTIVVFSSDHGSPSPKPPGQNAKNKPTNADQEQFRLNLMGFNGNLSGGKHGMEEGGVRVPFIIRWPGRVPAGRVDEQSVTSGIDWLPTLCRLAGVAINAADFDGEDVSAAWLGGTHVRSNPLLWKTSNPKSEMGIRDGNWKLHHPNRHRGEVELYDVVADPTEAHNVAAQHPEIVQRLSKLVEQWNATLPTEYLKTGDKDD